VFKLNIQRVKKILKFCLTGTYKSNKHVEDNTSMGVPKSSMHMKRLAVSAGMVALGVAVVQAGPYSLNSLQSTKPWSVAATLRGFYDDNVNLEEEDEDESVGFELRPSIGVHLPLEQTLFSAQYTYSYRYYDNVERTVFDPDIPGFVERDDSECRQEHRFDLGLTHSFSERHVLDITETFVWSEEPGLEDPSSSGTGLAEAIRNYASIKFNAELTEVFGIGLGYRNAFYDYDNDGLSSVLDRMEHTANIDLRWRASRNTVALLGYQFGQVGYLENDELDPGPPQITSEDRNNYTHTVYLGVEHAFNPNFNVNVRAGGQLVDYYNDPLNTDDDIIPWVSATATYRYTENGDFQLGFSHTRNQTDAFTVDGDSITQDQQSSVAYLRISHRITPKLVGSLDAHGQWSEFNGGLVDGDNDTVYGVGLNFSYSFNEHFSAELGYTYDTVESDSDVFGGREYDRNRFYVGVTAAY
jgi:hypothetical protein